MTSRLQQRRDTAANWTSNNPTLAGGEIGYETDTKSLRLAMAQPRGLHSLTQQQEQLHLLPQEQV